MSNYTQLTIFTTKDNLTTGDPDKKIKGVDFDGEFDAISDAISTKADVNSPNFGGTPTAPTASAGTNTTQLATTAFVTSGFTAGTNTFSGTQAFKDASIQIVGTADTSKKVTFDSSAITTATTRTLAFQDKSGTIALTSDIVAAPTLTTASNVAVSGSYSVTSSSTITFTATNTFSVGQEVFIGFSDTALTDAKYTIVTASSSEFTITYGSSVTSSGTFTAERYGTMAFANSDEIASGTSTLKAVTPKLFRDYNLVSESAVSVSGLSAAFTGIPSWVKRISVIFKAVSLSGSDRYLIQIGSGSSPTYATSGYVASSTSSGGTTSYTTTSGFYVFANSPSDETSGVLTITKITGNTWVASGVFHEDGGGTISSAGYLDLGATLTAVKIIPSGSNTFDAGLINIIYE